MFSDVLFGSLDNARAYRRSGSSCRKGAGRPCEPVDRIPQIQCLDWLETRLQYLAPIEAPFPGLGFSLA